jgi:hypothetical protein
MSERANRNDLIQRALDVAAEFAHVTEDNSCSCWGGLDATGVCALVVAPLVADDIVLKSYARLPYIRRNKEAIFEEVAKLAGRRPAEVAGYVDDGRVALATFAKGKLVGLTGPELATSNLEITYEGLTRVEKFARLFHWLDVRTAWSTNEAAAGETARVRAFLEELRAQLIA